MADDLARFVEAQKGVYPAALAEMKAGRKQSHWMWFIFPQIEGLGMSAMSQRYAIASLEEARDYLAHPVLGERLRECVAVLNGIEGRSAEEIMGGIDAVKLRSSLTLFSRAGGGEAFAACLDRYFGGKEDPATLRLLD
jgi:uncharacterized protein (DUF1810 family)